MLASAIHAGCEVPEPHHLRFQHRKHPTQPCVPRACSATCITRHMTKATHARTKSLTRVPTTHTSDHSVQYADARGQHSIACQHAPSNRRG